MHLGIFIARIQIAICFIGFATHGLKNYHEFFSQSLA